MQTPQHAPRVRPCTALFGRCQRQGWGNRTGTAPSSHDSTREGGQARGVSSAVEELPVLVKTRTRGRFNQTPNEAHWKPLKQTLRAKRTINWWDPSPQDAAQDKGLVGF